MRQVLQAILLNDLVIGLNWRNIFAQQNWIMDLIVVECYGHKYMGF